MHAREILNAQAAGSGPIVEFARANKFRILVRPLGHQAEHVFGADDGHRKRLGIAIDGRENYVATRANQFGAAGDEFRRIGNVFEYLEAGDDIEVAGFLARASSSAAISR